MDGDVFLLKLTATGWLAGMALLSSPMMVDDGVMAFGWLIRRFLSSAIHWSSPKHHLILMDAGAALKKLD